MNNQTRSRGAILAYLLVALVVALITAAVTALLVNIFQRKQEQKNPFLRIVEVTNNDLDPAKWGINWPREYDGYQRTAEPTRTKYGGGVGAEGSVPPEKAERDPWLKRIFAGYLFAVDYRDRRGHAFMIRDQEMTKRNVRGDDKQSGNCLQCHTSIIPFYEEQGKKALPDANREQQIQKGLELASQMSYWDAHDKLDSSVGVHPVGCVDCHDPKTMELRTTRPAFLNAIRALAESSEPVPHLPSIERWRKGDRTKPYDPNVDGTRQEMRSFVCGQCHVTYYCGKGITIFYPWNKGLKVEQMESYYDSLKVHGERFKDWQHAETGMPVIKAKHPEFEMWSQGIHARSGVACADCHMPYKREGAMKVSEHWVRSPLLMVNRSCQPCHPYSDDEIKQRVETIQDRHYALMKRAGSAATDMLDAIIAVRKPYDERNRADAVAKANEMMTKDPAYAKLTSEQQEKRLAETVRANLQTMWAADVEKNPSLKELGELQRAAQWRLDFVAAENSMGFHAPQEGARVLGESIDLSRQAQTKAVSLMNAK